jgi:hypothetical protein
MFNVDRQSGKLMARVVPIQTAFQSAQLGGGSSVESAKRPQNLVVFVRDQVQTQWLPQEWVEKNLPTSNWLAKMAFRSQMLILMLRCVQRRAQRFSRASSQHNIK